MKVFQHTRNERNLFFNPDRPDRSDGDNLLRFDWKSIHSLGALRWRLLYFSLAFKFLQLFMFLPSVLGSDR